MVDDPKIPLYGVILAGGIGSRFWPLSRSQYPKQVLRLLGSESMIQSTIERLLPRIPLERMAGGDQCRPGGTVISLELRRKGWENLRLCWSPRGAIPRPRWGWPQPCWERRPPRASWRCFRRITLSAIRPASWRPWTWEPGGPRPVTW